MGVARGVEMALEGIPEVGHDDDAEETGCKRKKETRKICKQKVFAGKTGSLKRLGRGVLKEGLGGIEIEKRLVRIVKQDEEETQRKKNKERKKDSRSPGVRT